jgi:glycosyltransferase involved in cell wall biosynthesis
MKILMLHNRYLVHGGEEQTTVADAALLAERGHQVELLERDNLEIAKLGRVNTALGTFWSVPSYRRIERKLRTEAFDILHVQNFFPLWSPSVYYAAARHGVPVVQTLQNYRLMCLNTFMFRENRVCEDCLGKTFAWSGVRHKCYRDSRAGSMVVAGMVGMHRLAGTWNRKVNAYIAVSDFAKEKYIANGLPAAKITVRPNFLGQPASPGPGGGGYALYVGRLSPEKGIATMLAAWKAADRPLPLKIAGDGPLKDMVMEAARTSPVIEYLGLRPLEEVLRLMSEAEFLVFPSEWYETMGRTIMESFAVGTPVLAARIGAPASMVTPGRNGFHFAAGDVLALRQLVEKCSADLDQVRKLRSNARATFEEKYSLAAGTESLLAVYRAARERVGKARDI